MRTDDMLDDAGKAVEGNMALMLIANVLILPLLVFLLGVAIFRRRPRG